ncbi:hypothetical protein L7F22_059200 [Adiantum nelumboides]|nr:hypothetical protein [Adiantum nelumboides]
MSVFPPFFGQVARVYSAAVNEESLAMLGTNKLPLLDQRTTHRLQNTKQFSTYYVRDFSAVSLINNESHQEVVFPGVKRRGRPRKIVTDNGANSQDILQGTKRRGRPKKIVIDDIPREPKRRGHPRKTAVDNGPKNPDSTNSYPFYVQENKQEHDPTTVNRQGHLFHYTDIIPEVIFQQLDNECEVSQAVIQFIAEVSRDSIQSHGWFTIALPGGSLVKLSDLVSTDALLARSPISSGSRLLVFQRWTPQFDQDEFDRQQQIPRFPVTLSFPSLPIFMRRCIPRMAARWGIVIPGSLVSEIGTPRIQVYAPGDTQFPYLVHIRDRAG